MGELCKMYANSPCVGIKCASACSLLQKLSFAYAINVDAFCLDHHFIRILQRTHPEGRT